MGDVQVREQCGKECPETLEVDAQGLELYCRDNGENSLVIIVEAVVGHDVDARALDEAVRMAEECFDAFGCALASSGHGLVYRRLTSPARAYGDVTGRRWRLGTDETNGRLYRVTYDGPRITVSLHHGLTDGRGAFEYLKTLLYYYLKACGHDVDGEGKVHVAGEAICAKDAYPYETYGTAREREASQGTGSPSLFGIPEDYLDEHGEYKCRHVELALPVAAVLSRAHGAHVTVTSLLVAAVDRAIGATYGVGDEMVMTCVTCDLRPVFESSTLRNFSGWTVLAETAPMRALELDTEAQVLAGQLVSVRDREVALAGIGDRLATAARLKEAPVDGLFGNEERRMAEKRGVRSRLSCMVTNVGVVDLPADIARHVRKASFRIPSFNATMTVSIATCCETLTMNVTQPFVSLGFASALTHMLADLGLEARMVDHGLEAYDVLGRDAVCDLA